MPKKKRKVKKRKKKVSKNQDKKIVDVNQEKKINNLNHLLRTQKLTLGQKAADVVTRFAGSWLFIALVFILLFIWMGLNTTWLIYWDIWDPYPFILLNLALSCLAAIQAPIILMSQNRAADRDRVKSERDHIINRKAEREIKEIQKDLKSIKRLFQKKKRKK